MNWATTAAGGINNGPNGGKSLAEIQAEEEEQERKRQERERQQKRERQKEMGLAQVSFFPSTNCSVSFFHLVKQSRVLSKANRVLHCILGLCMGKC